MLIIIKNENSDNRCWGEWFGVYKIMFRGGILIGLFEKSEGFGGFW